MREWFTWSPIHQMLDEAAWNSIDIPVMKGCKWYSLKKELRPFITGNIAMSRCNTELHYGCHINIGRQLYSSYSILGCCYLAFNCVVLVDNLIQCKQKYQLFWLYNFIIFVIHYMICDLQQLNIFVI